MIIIMKDSASAKEIEAVESRLAEFGFQTHPIYGEKKTVIGAIGDKRLLSMNEVLLMKGGKLVSFGTPKELLAFCGGTNMEDVYMAYLGGELEGCI